MRLMYKYATGRGEPVSGERGEISNVREKHDRKVLGEHRSKANGPPGGQLSLACPERSVSAVRSGLEWSNGGSTRRK